MLKTTTSALALAALLATGAAAQDTAVEQEAEEAGEAIEQGAETLAQGAENAAEEAGDAVQQAGEEIQQEAGEAAGEVEATAEELEAEALEEQAEIDAEVQADTAVTTEEVEVQPAEGEAIEAEVVETETVDVEVVEEPEVAEGTPVEGQIFEQSMDSFLASTLLGATVLSAEGEDVGEVNDMILASDGSVEGVVVGVGGFLGLGEQDVAVEFATIEVRQDPDTDELTFVLDATEEELEAAPEFRTRAVVEAEADAGAAMEAVPAGTDEGGAVVAPTDGN